MEALSLADLFALAQQQQQTLNTLVEIAQQQAAAESAARQEVWLKPETLSKLLGDAISPSRIKTDLRAGYFKEGLHYIITSNGAKQGHYGFSPSEIRKFYKTPPEKRRIYSR